MSFDVQQKPYLLAILRFRDLFWDGEKVTLSTAVKRDRPNV